MSPEDQLALVTQYRELGATQVDFDAEGSVCRVIFPAPMVVAKLGQPRAQEPAERPPQRSTVETSDEMRQARYKAILGA